MKYQIIWEINKIAFSLCSTFISLIFVLFSLAIVNYFGQENIFLNFACVFIFEKFVFIFSLILILLLYHYNRICREKLEDIEIFEKYPWNKEMFEKKGWDNFYTIPSKKELYRGVFKLGINLKNSDPLQFSFNYYG